MEQYKGKKKIHNFMENPEIQSFVDTKEHALDFIIHISNPHLHENITSFEKKYFDLIYLSIFF